MSFGLRWPTQSELQNMVHSKGISMENIYDLKVFSVTLFEKMKHISPAVMDLELYEFQYALKNITPVDGWRSVQPDTKEKIEARVSNRAFYDSIQIKHRVDDRIVLDEPIVCLTNMLFVGLVNGAYEEAWINNHFYFDVRGFFFLHRTVYFTGSVLAHFGRKPYRQFEQKQKAFERFQGVGYKDFMEANADVDQLFIASVHKLIAARGTPILLAVAGPTAAGKTEVVERLRADFEQAGKKTTSIELDNFLTDRDYREEKGIFTQGKQALHFELFKQSLKNITNGKRISIPRYDFVYATSSHDLNGNLKPDGVPIEIEPADIIFIEGNFPFLIDEVAHLIGIKVVYLTDDPIRLKRKWKRDIDYRKKYEPTYFRNRYFKDQFIMAEIAYRPQLEVCDLCVDTSGAALWATPEIAAILDRK
jgi:uridine kinase